MSVLSKKITIFAVANPQWVGRHNEIAFSHRSVSETSTTSNIQNGGEFTILFGL